MAILGVWQEDRNSRVAFRTLWRFCCDVLGGKEEGEAEGEEELGVEEHCVLFFLLGGMLVGEVK